MRITAGCNLLDRRRYKNILEELYVEPFKDYHSVN